MNRLVIIGNGFDLHHGLLTSYKDFRDYLAENVIYNNTKAEFPRNSELLYLLDSYFYFEHNWSDFEEKLSSFDLQSFIEEEGLDLVCDDEEDIRPMHDQAVIEDNCFAKLALLINGIPKEINNWIYSLSYDKIDNDLIVRCIDNQDMFISFNYSSTLEDVYQISPSQIIHIHGLAQQSFINKDQIIVGHGNKNVAIPNYKHRTNLLHDMFAEVTYEKCKHFYRDTYKDPFSQISFLSPYLSKIKQCKEVLILGHSLGSVDEEYFKYISKNIQLNTRIYVFYHKACELNDLKNRAEKYFFPHETIFLEW